ncbi:MAG: chaperone modulator CbpM [Xenophilus sp.]
MSHPKRSTSVTVAQCTVVGTGDPLAAAELARACGATLDWVAELAATGILDAPADRPVQEWRFGSAELRRALETRRLQRDFEVGLDAAALILDLQHEVRRLKSLLRAHRLGA